jgi:hypothetical protein
MIASMGDNLYIITLHTFLDAGHNSRMCALISYVTSPLCHFLFPLCSVGKILREQSLLTSPVVVDSSVEPTSSPP